jgi:hypothetical protein
MSTIKITNFRALKKAEINLQKIVLIAADNEGGKTSFIQACRAVLTEQTMPVEELTKKSASLLVHSGTAGCEIEVVTNEGESKITFPSLTKTSSGKPLEISEFASGARSLLNIEKKQRSNIISDMLQCSPTQAELIDELKKQNITDAATASKIWQTVQAQGWDSALSTAQETGAKNKTLWENETGENFGIKKAAEWMPKEWTPDLAMAKREDLEGLVKQEQEWLEIAISDQAVSTAEIDNFKKLSSPLQTFNSKITALEAEIGNLQTIKEGLQKLLANLPPAKQPDTEICPHCKGLLTIINGKIAIATTLSAAELKQRCDNIAQTEDQIRTQSASISTKNTEMVTLRAQQRIASDAALKLKKISEQKKPMQAGKNNVEDCRARVATAQGRLSAFDRRAKATRYAGLIETNQRIIDMLSPAGLRLTVLKNKLTEFNQRCKNLCDIADWAPVELREDMSVVYRGTPYMLISTAAQFKTRIILQIASAIIDGSPLVLIDAADVLTSNINRNGLFSLLLASGLQAIVAMSFGASKLVPRLQKIGGHSYWINDGVTEELL